MLNQGCTVFVCYALFFVLPATGDRLLKPFDRPDLLFKAFK